MGRGLAVVGGERITLEDNTVSDVLRAAGILVAQEGPWRTRASIRCASSATG